MTKTKPFAYLPTAPLVLASTSLARRRLFDAAGLAYEAIPSGVDEAAIQAAAADASPADIATLLAEAKAQAVAMRRPEALVVAGDQLLVMDGKIYNKPKTKAEAETRLRLLAGKSHNLVTAAIMVHGTARVWHFVATTEVTLHPLTDDFIGGYCRRLSLETITTSGVYMLEGLGMHIVASIKGCPYAGLGFPMLECLAHLRTLGLRFEAQP